jgi:hypothetical protein
MTRTSVISLRRIHALDVSEGRIYVYAILYGLDHEIPKTSRKARSPVVFL